MKTFKEMKSAIGFCQTDDFFIEYVRRLTDADIITVDSADIDAQSNTVSDAFYERLAGVFGISLDENLQPLAHED